MGACIRVVGFMYVCLFICYVLCSCIRVFGLIYKRGYTTTYRVVGLIYDGYCAHMLVCVGSYIMCCGFMYLGLWVHVLGLLGSYVRVHVFGLLGSYIRVFGFIY